MGTQLLHDNLWQVLAQHAKKAKRKRVAVAYFTTDLIGFSEGDLLVTDASIGSIKCRSTSAAALRTLFDKSVEIYSCPSLHAKMMVLGNSAFVGSSNLSESSRDDLNEAGLLTDNLRLVHEIEAAILRLAASAIKITESRLAALEAIKLDPILKRRPSNRRAVSVGESLGTTWLIHIYDDEPEAKVAERLNRAIEDARSLKASPRNTADAFYYTISDVFSKKVAAGDRLITIWSKS